jgi:hypothetical protein
LKELAMIGRIHRLLALLAALAVAGSVLAVDGVIEINQARALEGGITAGDPPGFPIEINASGSYRFTSNIDVPSTVNGVRIAAGNVTLDLNGFVLSSSGEVGNNDGIIVGDYPDVEVRNGTVRFFFLRGIFFTGGTGSRVIDVRVVNNLSDGIRIDGVGSHIERCTALDNGQHGIHLAGNGLVLNSVVRRSTSHGLFLGTRSGYRSNVLTDNNGGNLNAQVSNGQQLGLNLCGNDLICP